MRRTLLVLVATTLALAASPPIAQAVGLGGWEHVGVGATSSTPSLNAAVYALNAQQPGVLLVGGSFTSAGGNPKAQRIARWNGASWSALGTGGITNGAVHAIAYAGGKVYVGGTFLNAGGNDKADFLAVWDGSTWQPFCQSTNADPTFNGNVNALQVIGTTLYVGGAFQNGAGIASADYLLACNLTTGSSSSTVPADGDFGGAVYALAADSNGTLYAGGGFINLADLPDADHIASYDGSWHALGTGVAVDSFVRSLAAAGSNVYVGTDSVNVAGIQGADHVARWNGSAWSALGSNSAGTDGWFPASSFIYALTTYGSLVFAAGSFQNANGNATADDIAYFDGTSWRPLGSDGAGNGPFSGNGTALGVEGGKVFVGGSFTTAGGDDRASFLAASALRQPDAAVGGSAAGPFTGVNRISSTGAGEVRSVSVQRGHGASSYVRVQNHGQVAATFTIKGSGGAQGLTESYFQGATNITAAVRAGTWSTGSISPRAGVTIRLVAHVAHTSAGGATFVTTARSQSGTPPDAVRVVVTAHG